MADITKLFLFYGSETAIALLNQAIDLAKVNPNVGWGDIQNALKIATEPACIIQDWLSDEYLTEPRISKYWIRRGKVYVANNPFPTIGEMSLRMRIGNRTAFFILIELQKKGLIGIKPDLSFDKLFPQATNEDLIKQMKMWSKKYRGRCEPELLARLMFTDIQTAERLSKHGIQKLGLGRKIGQHIKKYEKQNLNNSEE